VEHETDESPTQGWAVAAGRPLSYVGNTSRRGSGWEWGFLSCAIATSERRVPLSVLLC
jgi:hypothetical protein